MVKRWRSNADLDLLLNTAVDSDVAYDGAELNSVCCKYSQSLEKCFIQ